MKLDARRIDAFLRDPGTCRVVLLHGDDAGIDPLIGPRRWSARWPARWTIRSASRNWTREAIARLPDEAAGLSLTGGRRVVRVREVTDAAATAAVQALLTPPRPALVVLEGASLPARSQAAHAAGGRAGRRGDRLLSGGGAGAGGDDPRPAGKRRRSGSSREALAWLAVAARRRPRLDPGRAGETGAVCRGRAARWILQAAMTCVGDLAGLSLDDALFAATAGDVATADRALELAMAEGAAPVQVLRAGLGHLQRLHRARLAMDEQGLTAAEAAKGLRPPVFYRRVGAFTRALGLWPSAALAAAMAGLAEAERGCKRTGWPDQFCAGTLY